MANAIVPTAVLQPSLDASGFVYAKHGENIPSGTTGTYTFVQGPSIVKVETAGYVYGLTSDNVYIHEHVPDDGRSIVAFLSVDMDATTAGGALLGCR